jgi:P22_AR N-terminal domain/Meiotically up-regulated gene 113
MAAEDSTTSAIQHVPFYDDTLLTLVDERTGKEYVLPKPMIELFGLAWGPQLRKMKRNPIFAKGMVTKIVPSAGGPQETVLLERQLVDAWLLSINPSRLERNVRDKLLKYQGKCTGITVDAVAWKTTYLYAVKQGRTRYVKIGISTNYRQRFGGLQNANPSRLSFLGVWDIGTEARRLEKSLHTFFHSSRILREWFSLSKIKEQRLFALLREYPRVLVPETEKRSIAQPMTQLELL